MKRQPRILAGTAIGLLMASAPLGTYPLQGIDVQQALSRSASQPIIRIQADCPEGASAEDCAKPRGRKAPRGEEAAPAQGEGGNAGQRRKQQREAEPAPAEQSAPAQEQAPAEAEQPKPRKLRQKQAEQMPDAQRREELSYDTALTRLAKGVCPGCERPVDLKNEKIDFCPHCGIGLFDHCVHCNTRKGAFSRFCHACGTPAQAAPA